MRSWTCPWCFKVWKHTVERFLLARSTRHVREDHSDLPGVDEWLIQREREVKERDRAAARRARENEDALLAARRSRSLLYRGPGENFDSSALIDRLRGIA